MRNKILTSFKPLLSYRYFIFDCDGVLWHQKKELFGSFNIIRSLEKMKKEYFFLTNNSGMTQSDGANYAKEVANFPLDPKRFISAAFLAGQYAKARNYKKIYIIGTKSIFDSVSSVLDNSLLLGKQDTEKKDLDNIFFESMHSKRNVDAVIVGKDHALNYYKLAYAICSINKGAELVACHKNMMYKKNNIMIPNAGATIAAIEAATGKKAFDLGKPGDYGIKTICKLFQIDLEKEKKDMLIIGDNIGVEIQLANNLGIDSVLVLSGNTTRENIKAHIEKGKGVMPTYIIPHLTYNK